VTSLRWHLCPALEPAPAPDPTTVPTADPSPDAADLDQAPAWTDDAVLNGCRAWQRVRTGHWSGKADAATELLAVDGDRPYAPIVRRAVAARSGGPRPTERDARAFQRTVLAALLARSG
jgi:hypothetical protein